MVLCEGVHDCGGDNEAVRRWCCVVEFIDVSIRSVRDSSCLQVVCAME